MKLDGLRRTHEAPYPVRHDLRISPAELTAIAGRHCGAVEQHQSDLPLLHPSGRRQSRRVSAEEAVRKLAENGTWLTLFGVQDDVLLRPVADRVRGLVGPGVEVVLSLVCSSSGGITPAHMDTYDVLLLQLQGRKRLGTGAFSRRQDVEAELRRRFGPARENLRELPDQRREWPLQPGAGVVIPAYTPHWAFVQDEVSVALSIALRTAALRRREAVHRVDAAMLRRRVRLPAPGRSRVLDEARVAMAAVSRRLR